MRTYRIYKIGNSINNLLYVGYTTLSLERRMKTHIKTAYSKKPRHSKNPLYIAMRKLGVENFSISLLEEGQCNPNEWSPIYGRERYWMGKLNTICPYGYNKHAFKLTDTDAAIIRFDAYKLTGVQYAELYTLHPSSVSIIRSSYTRSYNHVTEAHLPIDIEAYAKEMKHMVFIETQRQIKAK